MPFKKTGDGFSWDEQAARAEGRWSAKASRDRVVWIEAAEHFIARGSLGRVWDTLADPAWRPDSLTADAEREIVRQALRKGVELGRYDAEKVAVLLRLIPGDGRFRGENAIDAQRAIRAELLANPQLPNRALARKYSVADGTVRAIRKDLN